MLTNNCPLLNEFKQNSPFFFLQIFVSMSLALHSCSLLKVPILGFYVQSSISLPEHKDVINATFIVCGEIELMLNAQ